MSNSATSLKINDDNIEYEERLVAYIDILGWKEIINRSIVDAELRKNMKFSFDMLHNRGFEFLGDYKQKEIYPGDYFVEISQVSDSLIVSRSALHPPYYFTIELCMIQTMLLGKGFLLRGGLTIGKMYHRGNIAFGPALTRAYYLETTDAIYPRIVIDPVFVDLFRSEDKIVEDYDAESTKISEDGLGFINFLKFGIEIQHQNHPDFKRMQRIRDVIEEGLGTTKGSANVYQKYLWLANYYNSMIEDHPRTVLSAVRIK